MKLPSTKTPLLDAHLAAGTITREARHDDWSFEYFGLASDGVEVSFGMATCARDARALERYLTDHPTPDTW